MRLILLLIFCQVILTEIHLSEQKVFKTKCKSTYDISDISMGDSYRIRTKGYDKKRKYRKNTDCKIIFQLGSTCKQMGLSCDSRFGIAGNPPRCTTDYLKLLFDDTSEERYCSSTPPSILTKASSMEVHFRSNKRKQDVGYGCNIVCKSEETPTAAPTTAAPTTAAPSNATSDCACGKVKRGSRIVGGEETEVNEYPWQALLVAAGTNRFFCGGSLLNEKWVLTADHCIGNNEPSDIQVILGEHDRFSTSESNHTRKNVIEIVAHPNANSIRSHDFSLLKLEGTLDFSTLNHIWPVCFPTMTVPVGAVVTVTGWGTLSSGGSVSSTLQEVDVNVISNNACRRQYGFSTIDPDMLCAQVPGGGKDACQGDSGGPLVWNNDVTGNSTSFELHGCTSFGRGCALARYAGVYSRVNYVVDWIIQVTGGQSSCPRNDNLPLIVPN